MIGFIGGLALLLFMGFLAYVFILFLLKNIIKVIGFSVLLFIVVIALAATDNLPKPSPEFQKEITSPVNQ
jgi:predicted lipid-binding transport protein (Tim44 family)